MCNPTIITARQEIEFNGLWEEHIKQLEADDPLLGVINRLLESYKGEGEGLLKFENENVRVLENLQIDMNEEDEENDLDNDDLKKIKEESNEVDDGEKSVDGDGDDISTISTQTKKKVYEQDKEVFEEILSEVDSVDECQLYLDRLEYQIKKEEYRLDYIETVKKQWQSQKSKKDKKRNNIVQELLQTEKNYLAALEVLLQVYLKPIRARADGGHPLVDIETANTIFFKVEEICECHKVLYAKMGELINNWEVGVSKLSSLFLDLSPLFADYIAFVENYSKFTAALRNARKEFPAFVEYIDGVCLDIPLNKSRYRIPDIMIMPVQRVPRYTLLLESFAKAVGPTHHDYDGLLKAQEICKATAALINEKKRYSDSIEAVYELSNRLIGEYEQLDIPGRRLLHETKIADVMDKKRSWKIIFLFNDSIICSKKDEKDKDPKSTELVYLWHLYLSEINSMDEFFLAAEKRKMSQTSTTLTQIENELQAEANKRSPNASNANIPKNTKVLDTLHNKLSENQEKLELYKRSHGIRLMVEGKKHRVFSALFADIEERDEWLKSYYESEKFIKQNGPLHEPTETSTKKQKWNTKYVKMLKKEKAMPTLTGRLNLKIYGVNLQKQGDKKIVVHVEVDNESGVYTLKGKNHLKANSMIGDASEIPPLQTQKLELEKSRNFRISVYDSENGSKIFGTAVYEIHRLQIFGTDVKLPLLVGKNPTEENFEINLNCSFIPG